jgi:hypothetical protein
MPRASWHERDYPTRRKGVLLAYSNVQDILRISGAQCQSILLKLCFCVPTFRNMSIFLTVSHRNECSSTMRGFSRGWFVPKQMSNHVCPW